MYAPPMSLNEVPTEKPNALLSADRIFREVPQGLQHSMAIVYLIIWYISSGATLFSNKYILNIFEGDAFSLAMNQLILSILTSFIQMQIINKLSPQIHKTSPSIKNIFQDMIFIGAFRCSTVVLGLLAIKYIVVSFVATIKASSPLFTVIISRIVLGEKTGHWTKFSMIPITIGLSLCSSFELSFNIIGFLCALGTNFFECLQNVYSKVLISGDRHRYTAIELQFWASLMACVFQLPILLYNVDVLSAMGSTSLSLFLIYVLNGISYHIQAFSAYAVMAYISPITHSVANTVKRALLIWLSVLIFKNPVTFLSGFGTLIVIFGVIMYNEARDMDKKPGISSNLVNDNSPIITTRRDV
ncbi:unnamed protein product [Rotaria socialis]|uniref:Sugar phosphate transporter domain-containing protein n=1 Tax=Rotaria socialis TaxID=392032 RepID=A0A818BQA4_9BILA|nr:unnamed protein product [Rotaria socialis]CAF3377824.1 unnamed protein product [Rotaria socialis]CAF3423062.1 unnamed protein product [Rotaria socialis]CAF3522293.1 unnamed protein product [Rotaria socialis]CAF3730907.1 unnamed protein product [Rotaria socialis]